MTGIRLPQENYWTYCAAQDIKCNRMTVKNDVDKMIDAKKGIQIIKDLNKTIKNISSNGSSFGRQLTIRYIKHKETHVAKHSLIVIV